MLKCVRENILPTLKAQLSDNLSGVMSATIRQEMMDEITRSGRFPSQRFHNQYQLVDKNCILDKNSPSVEEICKHGSLCCSICCTGAFIVETMLSVVMNEDVREINFNFQNSKLFTNRYLHPKKVVGKFVPFQIPAILAHYAMSLNETFELKTPNLRRFCVNNVDIFSKNHAMTHNSMFEVLTMYDETTHYLEVPGYLSEDSGIGYQYGGFSEHLMMAITDIFMAQNQFDRLEQLVLGPEACNSFIKMKNSQGHCVSFALFHGIATSCPNLRILDISQATVAQTNFLYLFFHDAFAALHK